MASPPRRAKLPRYDALLIVVLSLALACVGCGRAEREGEPAVQAYYFKVDGMVQSQGIT